MPKYIQTAPAALSTPKLHPEGLRLDVYKVASEWRDWLIPSYEQISKNGFVHEFHSDVPPVIPPDAIGPIELLLRQQEGPRHCHASTRGWNHSNREPLPCRYI